MTRKQRDVEALSPEGEIKKQDARGNVTTQYDIYLNRSERYIMVLRFPNQDRTMPYNAARGCKPVRLRLKPKCGLVEVEIPISTRGMYDRDRGLQYGEAMNNSQTLQQGRSYGLAGGFGINPPGRAPILEEQTDSVNNDLIGDFENAIRQGMAMHTIILGGRMHRPRDGEPLYYIGVFRGKQLHLTRVDTLCTLSPTFQHIDALLDHEKSVAKSQRDGENLHTGSEARAINPTVKSTDDDELDMSGLSKMLRQMEEEPWQDLEWVDDSDSRSWQAYDKELFCAQEHRGFELVSAMTKQQYLDALSAPRIDPIQQGKKVMRSKLYEDEGESDIDISDVEEEIMDPPLPDEKEKQWKHGTKKTAGETGKESKGSRKKVEKT